MTSFPTGREPRPGELVRTSNLLPLRIRRALTHQHRNGRNKLSIFANMPIMEIPITDAVRGVRGPSPGGAPIIHLDAQDPRNCDLDTLAASQSSCTSTTDGLRGSLRPMVRPVIQPQMGLTKLPFRGEELLHAPDPNLSLGFAQKTSYIF